MYKDVMYFTNWIFLSLVCIYFLFNSGENVTNQFETFNHELYQSDWYLFPDEMQKMFVIFMSYSQRPVTIQGYGHNLAQCSRETFKEVIKSDFRWIFNASEENSIFILLLISAFQTIKACFSYFMALRQIYGWYELMIHSCWTAIDL